jgi:phosphoglycerol transferase
MDRSFVMIRLWSIVALLGIVVLGWCAATATWSLADLARPPAYLEDPSRADIIAVYAGLTAGAEGEATPFFWKRVGRLNAPFEANWTDWPSLDELHSLVLVLLARLFGIFAGLKLTLLLGHLLAAVTFFGVARVSGSSPLWSFVGGLAYGLAPFMFAQSPHHSGVQWAWHVPLFTLVWRWVSTDPGLVRGTPRFRAAMGIGFLAGLLNIYYTNLLCQLTLVGSMLRHLRTRNRPALVAALLVIAAAAGGFAVSNLDTWTHRVANGANGGALVREYKWLEIYGLKIKDLCIPPVTHRSDGLRQFGIAHRQEAVLNDEDGCTYLGILGLACLVWLTATSVSRMVHGHARDVPIEAWQLLWIVLVFTTGGLNAILGALGFTMFRAGVRVSVVILAIVLLWAAQRLTALQAAAQARRPDEVVPRLTAAVAIMLGGLVLWDQVPRAPSRDQVAAVERQVAADRRFAAELEAVLPKGAMVFQLPVMEFPESPAYDLPPYDHFRPYLFSKHLRFSFGSHKGRAREAWQPALQAKLFEQATLDQQEGVIRLKEANARATVDELQRLGFSAIYVNRRGFPDRGKGLEAALRAVGCAQPPIQHAGGDLVCIPLGRMVD